MAKENIQLFWTPHAWMAVHSDPEVRELFGTDTLPTAWTGLAGPERVLRNIQTLNPDKNVYLVQVGRDGVSLGRGN